MSTAQIVFSIAFALVAALIVFFSIYVFASTMWGDRWVRAAKSHDESSESSSSNPGGS